MKLRVLAASAALVLLTACGSDEEGTSDPDPTSASESAGEAGLSEEDLEEALLTGGDVPSALGEDFEQGDVGDGGLSGDDVIAGDDGCIAFLEDDYGPESAAEAKTQLESDSSEAVAYSTVKAFDEDEAAEELEALADVLGDCSALTVDVEGTEAEISVDFIDLGDIAGYEDFGDEGLAVQMGVDVAGERLATYGYTLVRIDDVITFNGVATSQRIGDDIMIPLSEAAVQRLEDVLADVS